MYPDTIFLFQEPLEEMCATHEESVEEIFFAVFGPVALFDTFKNDAGVFVFLSVFIPDVVFPVWIIL